MKKIVIEPCGENPILVHLTCSELDGDGNNWKRSQTSIENSFYVGKILHTVVQQELLKGNGEEILEYYLPSVENKKDINFIINAFNKCEQLPRLTATGLPVDILIEFGKYLVKLSGNIDGYYNSNIVEIKGYANKNVHQFYEDKYQLLAYAVGLSIDSGKEIKKIERWIFDKDNNAEISKYIYDFDLHNGIQIIVGRVQEIMNQRQLI